jgi:hypothetical protein
MQALYNRQIEEKSCQAKRLLLALPVARPMNLKRIWITCLAHIAGPTWRYRRTCAKKAERRLAVKEKTMTHSAAEVNVSELLRQAQPIATGALNLLFIWNWAKRIIPVCLTMAIILFIACLLAGGLLFVFGGR